MRVRPWAIMIAVAMNCGCSSVKPEVGDRLEACVDTDSDSKTVDFKTQVRPIILARCATCHYSYYSGDGTREGFLETGFDQETLGALRKGGRNTGAQMLVAGKPCSSFYVQKIRGTFAGGARMPKNGPYLSQEEIQLVMDWIAEGAQGNDSD